MRPAFSFRSLLILGMAVMLISVSVGIALWKWQGASRFHDAADDRPLEGLKDFGLVPPFSFVESNGRQVTRSDLEGKVSILNFIYTTCPDTCPIQSAQMTDLQRDFHDYDALRLVSITVDPKRDTPAVLREYAKRFHADAERWWFLTGERDAIYHFAQEGFHLGAVELPHESRPESGATHTHSPRFVLIDRTARIRGYYVSTNPQAMGRLRRDLKILLADKTPMQSSTRSAGNFISAMGGR